MSYPNRDLVLTKNEQHKIRKLLGEVKPIAEYLGEAAKHLKEGKDWVKSLTESAPWLKDVAEGVGSAVPIVNVAIKLAEKWLEQTHPFELGAVACTLAYQQAVAKAIEKYWTSAIGYNDVKKIDDRTADRIRELPPAEAADLSTFTRSGALQHPFVRRADDILVELMHSYGFDEALRNKVFDSTHDGFLKNLDELLANKKTAEKFAPFKDWMELDSGRNASLAALQIHAKYQRSQYESEPLFKREPYALKHIYVDTECGKLLWREIRGSRDTRRGEPFDGQTGRCDPFSENHGGRHNLLETVMSLITDKKFNEPIVIQGVAGAGKSSFTVRLCAELWTKGFHPIRIRLKRLQLSDSLIDALNKAVELADEERLAELPIDRPDDLLLKGEIFKMPYGGERGLCRYVLILDGWDELDLSDSKTFREKVGEMLREVRRYFLDPQRIPRVRVVVTGRPSPDVTDSKFLNDETPVLTMRTIRPNQLRKFVADLDDALGVMPPYVEVEKPEPWQLPHPFSLEQVFGRYEEAFNQSLPEYDHQGEIKELGQAPNSGSLEVLGLPLLAYLTIRVMAEVVKSGGPIEQQQTAINEMINNPTQLYRRLTDLTCEKAGKAAIDPRDDIDEVGRQAREIGHGLRDRLRRTAAAMSVLGVEHISYSEWEGRVPPDRDKKKEQRTQDAEDHPLSKLMVSFYFKGGQPEQGCEFAHKSFREYLFAECIVETLKDFGRKLTRGDLERFPIRDYWRDFSPEENRANYDFSRELTHLLAPQWITTNIWNYLRGLIKWEISRAVADSNIDLDRSLLAGLPTERLELEQWEWVLDGLADLWDWWCDGAHLRPQIKIDRWRRSVIEPPYVEELIHWASPLTAEQNPKLLLESATSMDAHMGDALCQICAMVHFYVALSKGWDLHQSTKPETEEFTGIRKSQQMIVQGKRHYKLYAPGGRPKTYESNPKFKHYIARINSVQGRPHGQFPRFAFLAGVILNRARLAGVRLSGTNLSGARLSGAKLSGARLSGAKLYNVILSGARLSGARLDGASLVGAILDGARLDGANLDDADELTLGQIKSAWIDERTMLPEDFENMKPQILEWQRQRQQQPNVEDRSVADEVEEEFEAQGDDEGDE